MVNILLSEYNFHEDWAREAMLKYIDANAKVVVIPFAFSEKWISNNFEFQRAYNKIDGNYYKGIVEPFMDFGIAENNIIWLNYFEDTEEEMRSIIEACDIVFLTGGLPDMAVKRVLEKGLLDGIRASDIIMGSSAGALMQLGNYFISPDEDYPEFMCLNGLELVKENFYIEVHYEESDIQKECIRKVLQGKTDIVYAIKDKGGLIVDNNEISLIGDVTTINK